MNPLLKIGLVAGGLALLFKDQLEDFFNAQEATAATTDNGFAAWKKDVEAAAAAVIAKPNDQTAQQALGLLQQRAQLRVIEGLWKPDEVRAFLSPIEQKVNAALYPPMQNLPYPTVPPPSLPPIQVTPPPQPGTAPAELPNFSQWIANTLGPGRRMMSADSWNHYYSQWSGVPQTADLFTPGQRGEEISLTDYLYRRSQQGLSAARIARMDPMRAWS